MENEVRNRVKGLLEKNMHQVHLWMYFERALLLMQSLKKLNNTNDFQTAICIDRVLLELLTYMVLVHKDGNKDKRRNSDALIPAWEESGKHNLSRETVKFYGRGKVPDPWTEREYFKKKVGRRVLARRRRFWNTKKHPLNSWTGKSFRQDVEDASKLWNLSSDSYSSLE